MIRVSGPQTMNVASKVLCSAKTGGPIEINAETTRRYCVMVDKDGHDIDDVVANFWHAPHGYTGEDSVEISCHGSRYILREAIQALIDAGCQQAQPGEYTLRAYLNGKMDLSQAESVADLVASTNRASHQMALSQMKGHFSSRLHALRDQLLKMTSLLELELDFSDHEELEFANRTELIALAKDIYKEVSTLTHSFRLGQALKEGIPVAIIGKTNVGKSTLLNALLHEDRAIVSDIQGTTRDVIEDTVDIHGITFRFIDTAGIRHTSDEVEQMGIDRSLRKLDEAQLIILLLDTPALDEENRRILNRCQGKKVLIAVNKADTLSAPPSLDPLLSAASQAGIAATDCRALSLSAKYSQGIDDLETQLHNLADVPEINDESVIVTNARHYEKLTSAQSSLERVLEGLSSQLPTDLIAEDLRMVLADLADITGTQITPAETLHNIFKNFCIGK